MEMMEFGNLVELYIPDFDKHGLEYTVSFYLLHNAQILQIQEQDFKFS